MVHVDLYVKELGVNFESSACLVEWKGEGNRLQEEVPPHDLASPKLVLLMLENLGGKAKTKLENSCFALLFLLMIKVGYFFLQVLNNYSHNYCTKQF